MNKTMTIFAIGLDIIILDIIIGYSVVTHQSTQSRIPILPEINRSHLSQISEVWQVTSVIDGDTINVAKGRDRRKLRLCGIDAPETAHKSGEISQPGGNEAKEFLTHLIERASNEVSVTFIEKDRYDRWISEIFIPADNDSDKEIFLNEELISQGYAWAYEDYWDNCPNKDAIASAKEQAIATGIYIGLNSANQRPSEWRRSH